MELTVLIGVLLVLLVMGVPVAFALGVASLATFYVLDIPLIVANDPRIAEQKRTASLAGNIDIPATVLDIAGESAPIGMSRSLLGLAADEPVNPRDILFCEFGHEIKTVDNGSFRYSYYPFAGQGELYDLRCDPDQLNNLAGNSACREIENELLKRIIDLLVLSRGFIIEAKDFIPISQKGISNLHPEFKADFKVYYPLCQVHCDRLNDAGLEADYLDFCQGKHINGWPKPTPYWEE